MANPPSRRIEVHSLFLREFFNLSVFLEVGFGLVLHVVIERHYDLGRIVDLGGADGHEFQGDGP